MHRVKVSNLPKWISELHLKQHFEACGTVLNASIALSEGAPRPLGYGYVAFDSAAAAEQALTKNGSRLDGAAIQVALEAVATESKAMHATVTTGIDPSVEAFNEACTATSS